jgi:hypothetical protein
MPETWQRSQSGDGTNRTRLATPDDGKNPHAVALGRLGGHKGGQAFSREKMANGHTPAYR